MKMKWLAFVLPLALIGASIPAQADSVRGYTRKDGTYVAPYNRSSPNSYRYDNYSSQGNSNPYTGQQGTQRNEFSNPPAYNQSYGGGGWTTPDRSSTYGY